MVYKSYLYRHVLSFLAAALLPLVTETVFAVPPEVADQIGVSRDTTTVQGVRPVAQSTDLSTSSGSTSQSQASDEDVNGTRAKLAGARARYTRVLDGADARAQSLEREAADNARELNKLVTDLASQLPTIVSEPMPTNATSLVVTPTTMPQTAGASAALPSQSTSGAATSAPSSVLFATNTQPHPSASATSLPVQVITSAVTVPASVWAINVRADRLRAIQQRLSKEAEAIGQLVTYARDGIVSLHPAAAQRLDQIEAALNQKVQEDQR
ncbi:MAG TPA: hypothetical protein VHD56_02505 [Tepidisphaeraceae bacterium]|nr:hypothetical protein [Tepidisphaeraceae bacterium]